MASVSSSEGQWRSSMIDSSRASSRAGEIPEMGSGMPTTSCPHSVNTLAGVRISSTISAPRDGRAEPKALHLVTSVGVEELELLVGLDAFGHHHQVEAVGEGDDRAHDRSAVRLAVDALDEGSVDLDGVDGHLGQVRQCAVSRAEVVDGTPHTEGAQLVQARDDLVDAFHEHALGHLELEQGGVQPRAS